MPKGFLLGVGLMWSNSGKETFIIIIIIMQHLQRHVSVVMMTNHRHDDWKLLC